MCAIWFDNDRILAMSLRQQPMGRSRRMQGFSIVELLIGVTVGLFVLAGASLVASSQLNDNRRLLLETQVQQDLRAAMDIITRDIRRSGYWANAFTTVAPATSAQNPYRPAGADTNAAGTITYTYSHDMDRAVQVESNAVEADEQNGFMLNTSTHTIDAKLSAGNWQALTDPNVVRITLFTAQVTPTTINLPVCAAPPCAPVSAGCGGASALTVRDVQIVIQGEATYDPSVKRSLVNTVRVRNDQVCQ